MGIGLEIEPIPIPYIGGDFDPIWGLDCYILDVNASHEMTNQDVFLISLEVNPIRYLLYLSTE
jgi:hypothetical protein